MPDLASTIDSGLLLPNFAGAVFDNVLVALRFVRDAVLPASAVLGVTGNILRRAVIGIETTRCNICFYA